jgi:steroid 5-alpha reductase family enzyme
MKKRIPGRLAFEVFNLLFISIFQLVLIFGFTFPLYLAGTSSAPLGTADFVLFALQAIFLILETIADEQQFTYYRKRGTTGDPRISAGFNTFGLWKYSRHPNYVCEMGQWLVVSLYPLAAGLAWWPSGLPALVLVALFAGSTGLAESISAGKYPLYAAWKKATPVWLPFTLPFRSAARKRFWESVGP